MPLLFNHLVTPDFFCIVLTDSNLLPYFSCLLVTASGMIIFIVSCSYSCTFKYVCVCVSAYKIPQKLLKSAAVIPATSWYCYFIYRPAFSLYLFAVKKIQILN